MGQGRLRSIMPVYCTKCRAAAPSAHGALIGTCLSRWLAQHTGGAFADHGLAHCTCRREGASRHRQCHWEVPQIGRSPATPRLLLVCGTLRNSLTACSIATSPLERRGRPFAEAGQCRA